MIGGAGGGWRSSSEVSAEGIAVLGEDFSFAPVAAVVASGDCAISESDDEPGLIFALLDGDGRSAGPGDDIARTALGFSDSSVALLGTVRAL